MSSCTINSGVIKALKSLAKKRKWSDEEFKQYCIDHNYNFEQIMNWGLKDNAGVPEKAAPVIPSVNQVSKLDGYVPDELDNSNTILSYYSDFPEEHIKMRKEFNQDVLTSTFVDINADEVFKNPVKYLGREGNLLNNELRNLKIKYINTLLDLIKESDNVEDLRINPDDTNVVKYKKYDTALKWAWNRMQSFKSSENYRTILNLYVKAKYFDSMVDSIPYIEVNKAYSNIFDNKHYTYVIGKIKHFTGLSSEEASAESQMSNMAKMIIDYLPETMFVDGKLKIINNTTVGLDAFYSMASRFKVWLYANKNDKSIGRYLKDEWRKGVNSNFYELLNLWRSKDNIGTLERNKLNTIINVIYGKYDDGRNVTPDDMKDVFSELIRTTVTSAYVDVSTEQSDTGEVRIKPTTLTEKRYLELMDPIIRNFIAGAWNYYRNHIEVADIEDGQGIINFLKDALFAHYIPSYDEFSENNNIANPKANSIDILNKVFTVFKQMAINNHPSEKEEIVTEADYIKNWYDTLRGKGQNQDFYSAILNFTKTISLSSRTSFKSVIKNSEGNYMPLRQLPSLAYMKDEQYLDVEDSEYNTENIIHENIDNVEVPLVRSSTVNNVSDSSSFRELSFEDMMTEAIVTDFLYNFNNPVTDDKGKKKTVIRVQPNCYADKSTNGVPGFNVSNPWKMEKNDGAIMEVYLNRLLRSVLNGKDNGQAESLLVETWRIYWNREIEQEYKTLAEDYRNIFNLPKEVSDDDAIAYFENYMLTNKVEDFIKLAYGKVDIISNVHYSGINVNGKKKVVFNPIIKGLLKLTSSKEDFNKYYKQGLEKFASKLFPAWRYIGNEQSVIEHFINENSIWLKTIDSKESPYDQKIASDTTISVKLTDGDKINPLVVAYFLAHNLLGESYNRYLFGNYYGHDIKANAINENGEYINLDELISSAWVSQTKRLAVVGATFIPYALGKKYGVADKINIAVVEDETAIVYNTNGEADEIDAKDGSGDVSPLFSRQANTSLQHASAGSNKKTIWHFYDHKHKTAGMLKWAEYEISNERMRDSWNSPTKEFIKFKKMHSLPFTSEQKMALADYVDDNRNDGIKSIYRNFEKLVYMNFNTGEYFKIKSIELFYDSLEDTLTGYVTHDDNTNSIPIQINNIFDLFQLMGGPWCYEWDKSAEKYIGSERNLDILNAIVCEKGLKSNFIAYLSNKSGMKTGIKNLNPVSVLSNDDDLMYFTEKVKYGGLQMNADHTLEESESTEPTQMIAHVGQDGTSHELVRNVYSLLANDINLELSEYIEAVDNKDRDKLVELVGKEIVKSFNSGDKDTISLAQTFIARASRTGDYNLPFNSDSINGLFTTALFSMFSKKTARRKYAGVGAVLNPSYNSKMYYRYNGKNYKFEEIAKIIRNYQHNENLQGLTINDVLTKPYLNGKLNKFMSEPIYDVNLTGQTVEVNPIEIGGEYIIHYTNEIDESGTPRYEKIKINTLEDLLKYKHRFLPGNYQYVEITRNTLAPMNLRGIDATYSLGFENNIYKISQVENPYNLALLHLNGKIDLDSIVVDEDSITASLIEDAKNIIAKTSEESNQKTVVRNMQKAFFNRLKINDSWNINGKEYSVLDITVRPTEIMIGRLYSKQLGLLPGDNLSDINDVSFFEKRMFDYYSTTDNPDNGKYDAILFDGAGKKLYVKVDEKLEVNNYLSNDDFQDRDGYIYNESKQICSSDGKRFVKYIDSNGRSHDYVIVNNIDRANEIAKGHYTYLYKNILPENVFNLGLNVGQEDVKEYASMTRRVEDGKLVGFIKATAHNKFTAFNKSLNFVGTRIPCQSMQSFTPMRVVAFTDSYDNQIYIPTHEQWIEGSKKYVIICILI